MFYDGPTGLGYYRGLSGWVSLTSAKQEMLTHLKTHLMSWHQLGISKSTCTGRKKADKTRQVPSEVQKGMR